MAENKIKRKFLLIKPKKKEKKEQKQKQNKNRETGTTMQRKPCTMNWLHDLWLLFSHAKSASDPFILRYDGQQQQKQEEKRAATENVNAVQSCTGKTHKEHANWKLKGKNIEKEPNTCKILCICVRRTQNILVAQPNIIN